MVVFLQIVCIRAKFVLFGQIDNFLGKVGKMFVFGQS